MKEPVMRHAPQRPQAGIPPLTLRIAEACRTTGIGRSKFYELIKDGAVEVIKVGAITLVPMSSIQALLDRGHRGHAELPRRGLADAMHSFLASAILTASLAETSEAVRRDLCSNDERSRTKAEDGIVGRMVAALYAPQDQAGQAGQAALRPNFGRGN
jgi:excisionase family DNA binding protein